MIINISRRILQFVFQSRICPFQGFQWHMCKFHYLSLLYFSFSIVLCVVLALNSWAIQSKACIFAAKHERSPFCGNHVEIIFRLFSPRTK